MSASNDFLFDDHSNIWNNRGHHSSSSSSSSMSKIFTNQSISMNHHHNHNHNHHYQRHYQNHHHYKKVSHGYDSENSGSYAKSSSSSSSASRFVFPPPPSIDVIEISSGRSSPISDINEKLSSSSNLHIRTCRKTLLDAYIDRDHPDYWPNRVTLKIDVAFTDHSHIIGRGGRCQKQIMKETGCHVHFPDSNRNPDLEKSNMVSIAGPLSNVEKARHELRNAAPLVVTFELKNFYGDATDLAEDSFIYEVTTMYGIGVLIRHNRSSGQPFVVVRGSVHQEANIKEALLRLQQHYLRTTKASCKTSLEILPPQQPAVLGVQNSNILLISELTGATIYHPESNMAGATTFFIQGSIDAVLSARKYLLGCLPVQLQFDVHQDMSDDKILELADLERRLRLSITLRPKRNGELKQSILVRGCEFQITSVYSVRRLVLDKNEPTVISPDYEFMQNFHCTGYLGSTVTTPLIHQAPLTVNSLILNSAPIPSPMFNALPAVFAVPTQFSSLSAGHQNCYFNNVVNNGAAVEDYSSRPSTTSFSNVGSSRASPDDLQPTQNNLLMSSTSNSSDLSNSTNSTSSVVGNLHNDPVPEEAPLASCLLETAKKFEEKAAAANRWKAPGAERDWVHVKVLANKAMQEKVVGPRMPNDYWAGFGFSRSMPAEAIRNRMQRENALPKSNLKDLEEEDEDKIGPWPLEKKVLGDAMQRKAFNATTYLDCPFSNGVSLSENDDIVTLLTKLDLSDLSKYIDIFREQEIDTKLFLTMNEEDLKDVGVNTFGSRRKMLKAISEINERKNRLFT